MATKTLRARYENGVLVLLESVDLPENAELTVRIEIPDTQSEEEEKTRRFLASAGSWAGLYDWDRFLEEIYRDREHDTRPDVAL